MKLLLSKKIAEKIRAELKKKIAVKNIMATMAVILVGNSKISKIYIREKEKACQEVGIRMKKYFLKEKNGEKEVLELIDQLNNDSTITAILVQLPLPKGYNTDKVLNRILPQKDVDGLSEKTPVTPPTAQAIIGLLEYYKIPIYGKKVCLIGYGRLVGKPLEPLLKQKGAKLTVCRSRTPNLKNKIRQSDIVISATGAAGLINGEMIKKNAVVVDAGSATEQDKIRGDVDFNSVKDQAAYLTPSKGGVGPLTVVKLLENIITLASRL